MLYLSNSFPLQSQCFFLIPLLCFSSYFQICSSKYLSCPLSHCIYFFDQLLINPLSLIVFCVIISALHQHRKCTVKLLLTLQQIFFSEASVQNLDQYSRYIQRQPDILLVYYILSGGNWILHPYILDFGGTDRLIRSLLPCEGAHRDTLICILAEIAILHVVSPGEQQRYSTVPSQCYLFPTPA